MLLYNTRFSGSFQDELIVQIADKLVELQNTEDNSLPLLRKQLADTNRGIENMLNAIQQGILTSSTKERLEALEKLREELKASILQAELEHPKYSREDIIEWISRFKYGDPEQQGIPATGHRYLPQQHLCI